MSKDQQSQSNPSLPFGIKAPTTATTATNSPSMGGFGAFASVKSPFATATGNIFGGSDSSTTPKPSPFASPGLGQNPQPGSNGGIFGSSSSGGGQTGSALGSNATLPGASDSKSTPKASTLGSGSFGQLGGGGGGGSIFGSSPSGLGSTASPFGGGGAQIGSALGSGGSTTATSNPISNSLFGGASTATTTPVPASRGLFGSQQANQSGGSNTTPSSNIFGGQLPLGSQGATSGSGLGSGGTTASTPVPSSITGNPLFGGASKPPFGSTPLVPQLGGQTAGQAGSSNSTPSANPLGSKSTSSTANTGGLFGGGITGLARSTSAGSASTAPPISSTLGATGPGTPLPSLFGTGLPKKPETAPSPGLASVSILGAAKDATKEDKTVSPFAGFGQPKDAAASKPSEPSGSTVSGSVPAGSTAAPTAVPTPSMLRGKTVEDVVNRWTADLEAHTREFSQFASEVAVWDRTLIENGNYISGLYASVIQAESTQASLDQTLDHVEQQQRQLTATLDQYEKTASEILHGPGGIMTSTEGLGLADSERDKSYALAANLYTQLDDLSRSLTQMVDSVNSLHLSQTPSSSTKGANDTTQEDPISTIAGILNAHLSSLQWIDGSLKDMERKVKDSQRKLRDAEGGRGAGVPGRRSYGLGSTRQ